MTKGIQIGVYIWITCVKDENSLKIDSKVSFNLCSIMKKRRSKIVTAENTPNIWSSGNFKCYIKMYLLQQKQK